MSPLKEDDQFIRIAGVRLDVEVAAVLFDLEAAETSMPARSLCDPLNPPFEASERRASFRYKTLEELNRVVVDSPFGSQPTLNLQKLRKMQIR